MSTCPAAIRFSNSANVMQLLWVHAFALASPLGKQRPRFRNCRPCVACGVNERVIITNKQSSARKLQRRFSITNAMQRIASFLLGRELIHR